MGKTACPSPLLKSRGATEGNSAGRDGPAHISVSHREPGKGDKPGGC